MQFNTYYIILKMKIFKCLFLLLFVLTACDKPTNTDTVKHFENARWNEINIPVIKMNLDGKERFFIVDTGANQSVIDNSFFVLNKDAFNIVKETTVNYHGVNGTTTSKVYILSSYLDNKHNTFMTSDISGVVKTVKEKTNIVVAGIIGSDFFENNEITIDFKTRTLIFN